MTVTTEAAGTELDVQVAPGALARVQGTEQFSVADLANLLSTPDRVFPEDGELPKAAGKITVTPKLRNALKLLPAVFGKVQPAEARELSPDELVAVTDEATTIQSMAKDLGARLKAIQATIRNHQDAQAEKDGTAEGKTRVADGVAAGHYLLGTPGQPYVTEVEGYETGWQQRYVKGESAPDFDLLLGLYESGKITRPEFLSFTREVRVLDENKMATAIRKNPGRGLQILALITRKGAPSASLYAPKK